MAIEPIGGGKIPELSPKRSIHLNKYSNLADAFNRLRVSSPTILFDSQLQYGKRAGQWFEQKSTSGAAITALSSEASVRLRVSTTNGTAVRQTRQYFRYQPGKSQLILMTFGDGDSKTGSTKGLGYYDEANGLFFAAKESGYYFGKRTSTSGAVVDTLVEQADWNIDKMNGTGPSGVTLDFSKVQILLIDLEWLGVGRARMGFVVDGTIVYAHEFLQANVGTEVYMATANLPLRYEVTTTGTATGNVDLKQICASVMSEGGSEVPRGAPRAISNDSTTKTVTAAGYKEILTIRPTTTFKGQTNRVHIVPTGVEIFSETQDIHYHIVYGGESNSSSAGWTRVSSAYSAVEYTRVGTSVSGGVTLAEGYISAAEDKKINFAGTAGRAFQEQVTLFLNIDGSHPTVAANGLSDQMSIVAEAMTTTAGEVAGVISWVEEK